MNADVVSEYSRLDVLCPFPFLCRQDRQLGLNEPVESLNVSVALRVVWHRG